MFYCVIAPVTTVWSTALIAISSPKDSDNWFTRLMRVKTDGKPTYITYSFDAVCRKCKKLPAREMVQCTHTKHSTPLHKDRQKMDKMLVAYQAEGLEQEYFQENLGLPTRSADCAFSEMYLDKIMNLPRVITDSQHIYKYIREILMCIDPNGGGMNRSAIVFGYFNEVTDEIVVCSTLFLHPLSFYCVCVCVC